MNWLLTALWYAAKKARLCHRDITPENIIIYRDSTRGKTDGEDNKRGKDHKPNFRPKLWGYLIDWDLAWPLDRPLLEGGLPFSVRH